MNVTAPAYFASQLGARLVRLSDLRWRWWWSVAFLSLGALALFAHTRMYGEFFIDDALISLRYSARLLEGEGLNWTDGERVEGYSNLLWVLLCAVPGLFGFDLIAGARVLGFLCIVASFGALLALASPRRVRDGLPALFGMCLLSATDSVAAWTCSGLEVPLGIALLAWGVVSTFNALGEERRAPLFIAASCFGLLCWTRPDGPLWGAGAFLALGGGLLRRRRPLCLAIFASVAGCVCAQLLFRRLYYEDWLPNTAYAKVVLNDDRLKQGFEHIGKSFFSLSAIWLALGLGLWGSALNKTTRVGALILLTLALLWIAYLLRMGGDIFPAWRHFGYLAALAAIAGVLAFTGPTWSWSFAPTGASLVVLAMVSTHFDPMNWAWTQRWEWDGAPVSKALRVAAGSKRPLIAVDAAGSIPYFSGLPSLDMLGLTDRYLAHHRPKNMGKDAMGHELGDPDYFLSRAPDVFCFSVPPCRHGPAYAAQGEMLARPEFSRDYVAVRLQVESGNRVLNGELYVRKHGKLGLITRESSLEIPALLLGVGAQATAEVGQGGRMVARLDPHATVNVAELALDAGTWRVETSVVRGAGTITVLGAQGPLVAAESSERVEFWLARVAVVALSIQAKDTGLVVSGVRLVRALGTR